MTMRDRIALAIETGVENDDPTSRIADAVLDVMREPTDRMVMAGIIERHDSETPEAWKLATANIFTAMIDAAKAE